MNRNVLIVDDDQEFTALLRGVFEQAGYKVHSAFDAEQGFSLIQNESIDLLVTDQRLPGGMSGSELIEKLRSVNSQLPVIMVSGFLNDDSIRDLIRNGVQGVFIKPLNIFSLLKKASEILEAQSKSRNRAQASGADAGSGAAGGSGAIGHIQGLSKKGEIFIKRAREAAGFKRNLLLIGPSGTLFEEIGRDIVALSGGEERCFTFKPGSVSRENLNQPFTGEDAAKPVTFIILDAENLSPEEIDRIISVVDDKGGSESSLRTIFCLSQTVEDLYDSERIDEELYLFLGTNELKVPALKEIPEDLVAIAKKELADHAGEANLDIKLRSFLLEYDWPENMLELRSVIVRAVNHAQPLAPNVKHFQAALNPEKETDSTEGDPRSSLERFLDQERSRYLAALQILEIS